MKIKGLYLVTDEVACLGRDFYWVVEQAVLGGVDIVQLREKNLSANNFLKRAQHLKALLKEHHIPLIINDRIDIALAVEADGVHIGQSDMPYPLARKILGKDAIIGLSIENWTQLAEAEQWDVDYLGVSPIFQTPTKTDTAPPWGLDGLRKMKQYTSKPLVAIGGVHASNCQSVVEAGADVLAVVSAICSADNPKAAACELKRLME